jgi:hypothetical protein
MPIIYLHGVNTRELSHFTPVQEYLKRIVAPAISKDPDGVSIRPANWFELCAAPKWGGISRPETALLGQGAERSPNDLLDALLAKAPLAKQRESSLVSGQTSLSDQSLRLDQLAPDDLADLMVMAIDSSNVDPLARARVGITADRLVHDENVMAELKTAKDFDAQLGILAARIQADYDNQEKLAGHGPFDFFRAMKDRIGERLSRVLSSPAATASVVAGEFRPMLNAFVTRFLGDLLYYMVGRGTDKAPGPIPSVLIEELKRADENKMNRKEPLVLLTHSMGGQIAYDTIMTFLPTAASNIKVDFWCATASQVGFFEELNMFLASSKDNSKDTGKKTPVPNAHLGHWWNVWDPNDILSFTTNGIFANGIDDETYWSGMSLAAAHGGYLERPSFYRKFAEKLRKAFPSALN